MLAISIAAHGLLPVNSLLRTTLTYAYLPMMSDVYGEGRAPLLRASLSNVGLGGFSQSLSLTLSPTRIAPPRSIVIIAIAKVGFSRGKTLISVLMIGRSRSPVSGFACVARHLDFALTASNWTSPMQTLRPIQSCSCH